MDPVIHFEMPFDNRDRMAKFYQSVFGWATEKMGAEMGNYVMATTTESGKKGPKKPGAINGGFFPKSADGPQPVPSIVIAVADIKRAMKKIAGAGGQVLGEPMPIPGVGSYVSFLDTEGNRCSVLMPLPPAKPAKPAKKKAKSKAK